MTKLFKDSEQAKCYKKLTQEELQTSFDGLIEMEQDDNGIDRLNFIDDLLWENGENTWYSRLN